MKLGIILQALLHISNIFHTYNGHEVRTLDGTINVIQDFYEEKSMRYYGDTAESSNYDSNEEENFEIIIEENDSNSTIIEGPIIENLKIVDITVHSLTISWSVAGTNTSSFLIEWFENYKPIGNANETFTDLIYTINNLYPCTRYKLTVTPDGSSDGAEIYGTTSKSKPSVPLDLTVNPLEIERNIMVLNISWGNPKVGNTCVKLYAIRISAYIHLAEDKREINTTLTSLIIENVHACTSYLVNVRPINLDDIEGDYIEIQSEPTPKRVTRQPELSHSIFVKPIRVTSTTATLYWEAVDPTNNCSIASVNTQCEYVYTEGYGFEVEDFSEAKYMDPTGIYTSRIISVTVENLSPYSKYLCRAWVENTAGRSKFSNAIPVTTSQKAPSPPQSFKYVEHPNGMFMWEQPRRMPGVLLNYRIKLSWKADYPVPDTCKVKRRLTINKINPLSLNLTWTSSEGFSNYEANIAAQTFGGWSEDSSTFSFRNNKIGVPDEVTNLTDDTQISKDDPNVLETILSWNLPCSSRGLLKYFEVSVSGRREEFDNHNNSTLIRVKPGFEKNQVFSTNLGELRAEYHYVFGVRAMTDTSDVKGAVAKRRVVYPAGIPPQPDSYYIKSITLDPDKIQRTSTSFSILLPLFLNTNGRIRYYAIIVSRSGYNFTQAHKRYDMEEKDWPDIASWKESMENDFSLPYQASEPRWKIYSNTILNYGNVKAVKVTIGEDHTCRDVSLASEERLYCNGPLKPGTWYDIRMRAFTSHGYSDSVPFAVKTSSEVNIYLIVGLVFGILLFGILVAMLLNRKFTFRRNKKHSAVRDDQDSFRPRRLTMDSGDYAEPVVRPRRRYE